MLRKQKAIIILQVDYVDFISQERRVTQYLIKYVSLLKYENFNA